MSTETDTHDTQDDIFVREIEVNVTDAWHVYVKASLVNGQVRYVDEDTFRDEIDLAVKDALIHKPLSADEAVRAGLVRP